MSSLNTMQKRIGPKTFEGAKAAFQTPRKKLERLTLAHMLWEDQFYIDGKSSAELLANTVDSVLAPEVAEIAKLARTRFKMRHVPLMLMRELARTGRLKADALNDVIQRPDEIGEFLSLYWKDKKTPVSNQVKKGLAQAFGKFNEYQLAKWDKNSAKISLRDAMFLTHPKPQSAEQAALFAKIANKELETPDTWETQLSAGADKRETFTRLMAEGKLGALAFLRNLRNMATAGVSNDVIKTYSLGLDVSKVLPFRYIAAVRVVPQFKSMLEEMMMKSLASHPKLPGKTVLLVDVSGSMFGVKVSAKSDIDRFDAAAALAMLCREVCEEVEIYSFSNHVRKIADTFRGFALVDAIKNSQPNSGTNTGPAVKSINQGVRYDRIMVFTDEQSNSVLPQPNGRGYIINVASYEHSIASGAWESITGFSEAIVDYIQAFEAE